MKDVEQLVLNIIKFINLSNGRDKMCRITQYSLMFLIPILKAQGQGGP